MLRLLKLITLISTMLNAALAQIIETNDFDTLEQSIQQIDSKALVVFDVQEVLMVAKDQVLRPTHKNYRNSLREKHIKIHPLEEQTKLFSIILRDYETEIVDSKVIEILKSLKTKHIRTIALTSGYAGKYGVIDSREDLRIKRLNDLGISFKDSFVTTGGSKVCLRIQGNNNQCNQTFKDGIIFTSRYDKGKSLEAFLKYVNFKPSKILFVDNQLKNLKLVEAYCQRHNIPFIGFHYNYIRSRSIKEFNQALADYQFEVLKTQGKWISDKDAALMIK